MARPTLFVSLVLPGQSSDDHADAWRQTIGAERCAIFSDSSLKDIDRRILCWAMASREDITLIHGRLPVDCDRHLPRPTRFACTLSNPERDFAKALKSWSRKHPDAPTDLAEISALPEAESLFNRQTHRLAGKAKELAPDSAELLERAIENLRTKFAWVGVEGGKATASLSELEAGSADGWNIELAEARPNDHPMIGLDLKLFEIVAARAAKKK